MPNRPQIKAEARSLIRTGSVPPIAATAVVLLIVFALERITELVEYGSPFFSYYYYDYLDTILSGDYASLPALLTDRASNSVMSMFFSVLVSLFTTVLYGGYYIYCMGIRQRMRMSYSTLADGLSAAGKLIWCSILIGIKTFLWSMLFVIPGLVAMYRYRFAYYNILTDPNLSASEAIRLSCQQTYGMKLDLFVLDISFIGWYLLNSVLSTVFALMRLYPLAAIVPVAINLWILPYLTLSDLAYFEIGQTRLGRPPYGGSPYDPYNSNSPWEL